MANIILQDYVANMVKVDGVCYYLIGNTHADPTHTAGQVEAYYNSCEKCISSSSSSSSSSTSYSSSSISSSSSSSSSSASYSSSSSSSSTSSSSSSSSTAPAGASQVVLIISGMTVNNWNGLGNGTHDLQGCEVLSANTHIWFFGENPAYDPGYLLMYHQVNTTYTPLLTGCNPGTYAPAGFPMVANNRGAKIKYFGTTGTLTQKYSAYDANTPVSINYANEYNNVLLGSANFTWSFGVDWSRGNM